jgi:glutathione synthase/RimK-type ligase-like ATP-grasp enzyme
MIAIHDSKAGFHPNWVAYCENKGIPHKMVNCYSNNIISQLEGCDALMWHHSHMNPIDVIVAKQIMFALEHTGLVVFPDFHTSWHFDDKIGQKYLFERIDAPLVKTYVLLSKEDALKWVENATFPKVFKLRSGSGASNVKFVPDKSSAMKFINRAFRRGFPNYDSISSLKERYRKWLLKKTTFSDVAKGIARIFIPPMYSKTMGREVGYAYFQDFVPNNGFDIRVIVISSKAFAVKRMVRENDFRASGSGSIVYDRGEIDERCIKVSFDVTSRLKSKCAAYDYVFDSGNQPRLIEISYGFPHNLWTCPGFWDSDLNWHEVPFDPCGWMVESVLKELEMKKPFV